MSDESSNIRSSRTDWMTTTTQLVKSEDLNHHQTLYAGRCVEWCVQAAYIAAERCFAVATPVVFMSIRGLSMRSPARLGELVQFTGVIDYVGSSTIGVRIEASTVQPIDQPRAIATGRFLFCTVDENGRAIAHHLPEQEPAGRGAAARWKGASDIEPGVTIDH
ncbi:MAG TPA: acyl-CoA thioesterase [Phycisphaerae bacterium]|nr:acyl-CoA thioesterase [Phycisphaerae bacterium]HRW53031.1 acyl-CoA thioesterase [Phycisphaerae bacterium]